MKSFFLALCAMLTILLSNAQQGIQNPKEPTPQEIYNLLNMSAEFNGGLTIKDLDHPWMLQVGQTVTYQLQDGHKLQFVAEKGDNFWNLGKKALKYQTEHPENPIVKPDLVPQPTTEEEKVVPPVVDNNKSGGIPWWLWLIGVVLLLGFGNAIFKALEAKRKAKEAAQKKLTDLRQPVTDTEAPAYMREVAQRVGPNVRIVGPVVKGRLTTKVPMEVSYREGTKMESFTNEPFYRALAEVDGADPIYLYFRQICGNDAKAGRIQMGGEGVVFVPDPVQTPELQTANQQVMQPVTEITEVKTEKVAVQHTTTLMKAAALAEEHINAGNEVVLKVTNKTLQLNVTAKEMLNLNLVGSNHKALPAVESSTTAN